MLVRNTRAGSERMCDYTRANGIIIKERIRIYCTYVELFAIVYISHVQECIGSKMILT